MAQTTKTDGKKKVIQMVKPEQPHPPTQKWQDRPFARLNRMVELTDLYERDVPDDGEGPTLDELLQEFHCVQALSSSRGPRAPTPRHAYPQARRRRLTQTGKTDCR